ncbi:hypothetical protein NUM_14430 [Actinocatenispora comari]|uniref:YlxR domain-containing protein n=1 Tax=Actinocatenispora comari TaxID=2807577 RepID=A0A8J4A761_9ACTN|nr:hypothetical protein NUM_14430 [Actinocatenispora comari]
MIAVRRASPVRTCVGCRRRAPATVLLRVVAVADPAGFRLVPDPLRRLPGRGAHVHRDPACVASARKRRAFARALRISSASGVDDTPVTEHVREHAASGTADGTDRPDPARTN